MNPYTQGAILIASASLIVFAFAAISSAIERARRGLRPFVPRPLGHHPFGKY